MTPHTIAALRTLVGECDVNDARQVANHVTVLAQQLSKHLARLVGELGNRALFERSIHLAGASFPSLLVLPRAATPYDALRLCLEGEQPDTAMEAGISTLRMFIELLERLIGERLVATLLHEVWPANFPSAHLEETK